MKDIILVACGGAVGSACRLKLSGLVLHFLPNARFPFPTLTVNLLGCLLIGIIAGLVEKHAAISAEARLFLITGILGGFTTFSAFGLEAGNLLRNGFPTLALTYASASVILGVMAVLVGMYAVR